MVYSLLGNERGTSDVFVGTIYLSRQRRGMLTFLTAAGFEDDSFQHFFFTVGVEEDFNKVSVLQTSLSSSMPSDSNLL